MPETVFGRAAEDTEIATQMLGAFNDVLNKLRGNLRVLGDEEVRKIAQIIVDVAAGLDLDRDADATFRHALANETAFQFLDHIEQPTPAPSAVEDLG